jgi:manganese/zinc/iron transport system ATP- binding protein
MMNDENKAIEVTDLTVAYREKPVLWDIDLEVPAGVLMAVVGPNGAGKTTLIKAILGLVRSAAGQVLIYDKPYIEQRWMVGYVPHLGWVRRPGGSERALALEALNKVGMRPFADRQISQLSGGQQQRVFLARAPARWFKMHKFTSWMSHFRAWMPPPNGLS